MANSETQSRTEQKSSSSLSDKNPTNQGQQNSNPGDLNKRIENFKTSAEHLQSASKYSTQAAQLLEKGDSLKAAELANKAQDCIRQATEMQQNANPQDSSNQPGWSANGR